MSSSQDSRLLITLINRVAERLPVNSGLSLAALEADPLFIQNVKSIVDMSQWRLRDVIGALGNVLDGISRSFGGSGEDPNLSADILHSQLFILRLLGDCTAFAWNCHREALGTMPPLPRSDSNDSTPGRLPSISSSSPRSARLATRSTVNRDGSMAFTVEQQLLARSSDSYSRSSVARPPRVRTPSVTLSSSPQQHKLSYLLSATDHALQSAGAMTMSLRPAFLDPPPLDENLARFLLAVITRFFYTSASAINTDTINHGYGPPTDDHSTPTSFIQSPHSYITAASLFTSPSFPSQSELLSEIHKAAGRVLFYLSASNWPVVFAKLKGRLIQLAQAGSLGTSGSGAQVSREDLSQPDRESGDLTELRFLEWCSINRHRLGMVLAELTHTSKSFSKKAHFVTAIVLRRAIWNWIETYPAEFQNLCQSQGRMEGNPDQLFDTFNFNADSTRRKVLYWPVQTMLLVLCPDILYTIGMVGNTGDRQRLLALPGGGNTAVAKKAAFLEAVRKGVRSKVGEVSVLCCVDLVKASTYVSKAEGGPLRLVGAAVEVELKEKLFDNQRPLNLTTGSTSSEEAGLLDHRLLAECVAALYKANPWSTLRSVVPIMMDPNASALYRVAFVKAFWGVVAEGETLPWNPTVDASLAGYIRQLFNESISRERLTVDPKRGKSTSFRPSQTDRKLRKAQQEEANERLQTLLTVLNMWIRCPMLAIAKDATVLSPEDLRQLFTGLTSCLLDIHPAIRTLAGQVITRLMSPDMVPYWDGTITDWRVPAYSQLPELNEHAMRVYWRGTSQILLGISRAVLEDFAGGITGEGGERELVALGEKITKLRNSGLTKHGPSAARLGVEIPDRFAASVAMEVAILVSLAGTWGDSACVGKTAAAWLSALLEEGELVGEVADLAAGVAANSPILENLYVYTELCKVVLGSSGAGGQKAVHKKARAILRGIHVPTPGNLGAWEEVYKCWKAVRITQVGRRRSASTSAVGGDGSAGGDGGKGDETASGGGGEEGEEGKKKLKRGGSGIGVSMFVNSDDKGDWLNHTAFLCALGGVCLRASALATEQQIANAQQQQQVPVRTTSQPSPPAARRKSTGSAAVYEVPESTGVVPWTGMVGAQLMSAYSNAKATVDKFVGEMVDLLVCDSVGVREAAKECLGMELGVGMYETLFTNVSNVIATQLFDTQTKEPRLTSRNTLFVDYLSSVLRLAFDRPDAGTVLAASVLGDVDLGYILTGLLRYLDVLASVDPTSLRIRVRLYTAVEVLLSKRDVVALTGEIRMRREILQAIVGDGGRNLDALDDSANMSKMQRDADLACVKAMVALLDGLPLHWGKKGTERFFEFLFRFLVRSRGVDDDSSVLLPRDNALRDYTIQALTHLVAANVGAELPRALDMMYHSDDVIRGAFAAVLTNLLKMGGTEERLLRALGDSGETIMLRYAKLVELVTNTEEGLDIAVALGEVAPVGDVDEVASVLVSVFDGRGKALDLIERVVEREVENTDTPANLFRRNSMATRLLTIYAKTQGQDYLVKTLKPLVSELIERCPPMSFEVDPVKLAPGENAEANLRNLKVVSQGVLDSIVGPGAEKFPIPLREACTIVWRIVGTRFPEARVTAVGGFLFLRFFCPAIVSPETHGLVDGGELKRELRRGLVLITKVVQNLANNVLFGVKEAFMSGVNDVLRENVARVHGFLRDVSAPFSSSVLSNQRTKEAAGVSELDMFRLHRHLSQDLDRIERLQDQVLVAIADPLASAHSMAEAANRLTRRSASHLSSAKDKSASPRAVASASSPSSPVTRKPKHKASKSVSGVPRDSKKIISESHPTVVSKATFIELATLLAQLGPAPDVQPRMDGDDRSQASADADNDSMIFSPVAWIKGSKAQIPVAMKVGGEMMHIWSLQKGETTSGGMSVNEMYHAAEIEDVAVGRDQEVVVKVTERGGPARGLPIPLSFASARADAMVQALRTMVNRYRLGRPSRATLSSSASGEQPNRREHLTADGVAGAILNAAMIQFGSEEASVRRAGYDLLCAACREFGISVAVGKVGGARVMSGKGVFVPFIDEPFLMDINERLANHHPDLTLGFLGECTYGLTRCAQDLKTLAVQYMLPWLPNLEHFVENGTPYEADKLGKIVSLLIEATVKDEKAPTTFQVRLWAKLGKIETLVPLLVDLLLQTAVDSASRPAEIETIANTVNYLASPGTYPVSGKVISRLRKTIAATSYRCVPALVDHVAWTEIAVLVRLALVLSFSDWSNIDQVLPELCYIISMVVGIGSPLVRSSVHGLVINAIHALCTSGRLGPAERKHLEGVINDLTDPKLTLVFGVEANAGEVSRDMPLGGLEMVTRCLLDVLNFGGGDSEQSAIWKARWMSLVASTAFQYNPAIQPRAFIVLGCLARREVDDDLLYQILVALRGGLTLFEDNDCHLIVSIVMCLCEIVGGLSVDSRYFRPMFWLALALIQIGHVPVFQSALSLMVIVLRSLDERGCFEREGVAVSLLRARDVVEEVGGRLDAAVGIRFRVETFSFAIAANLMKGLKHPTTKTATVNALQAFLDVAAKEGERGASERLGYVLPLLPSADKPMEVWKSAGLWDVTENLEEFSAVRLRQYRRILDQLAGSMDSGLAHLSVLLMWKMLEMVEYDMELCAIYEFLGQAGEVVPEVFSLISESLIPRMNQMLATNQSLPILDAVQRILQLMMFQRPTSSTPQTPPPHRRSAPPTPTSPSQQPSSYPWVSNASTSTSSSSGFIYPSDALSIKLTELGFNGLQEAVGFSGMNRARKLKNAALAVEVVDGIIGL